MIFHGQTIDGDPALSGSLWSAITKGASKYPRFVIEVREHDPEREISIQQMKYLHAVVFPTLAKEMHTSKWEAEFLCKTQCGEQWLVKKVGDLRFILSKTTLSVKDCNEWIENIWDYTQKNGITIPQPNKEWRTE